MTKQEERIDAACKKILAAKREESLANEERLKAEAELAKLLDCPEEGQTTQKCGEYKITIIQNIDRKVDAMAWSQIEKQIPTELRPVERVEVLKVVDKGVRWLKEREPGYYKLLSTAITEKPSKLRIKVEAV